MLLLFFIFIIGICIGSFLNVVIYRYNTGFRITGRSQCLSCGKTLGWYELVPLFSFLFQRGKCRICGSRLSWQYPLVEAITGAIFVGIFEKFGLSALSFYFAVMWSILIVIFVYDLRHKIIPDALVYIFICMSLVFGLFLSGSTEVLPFLAMGPAVALPFLFIWVISRGAWMGFGDVKLALGIGWLLGLSGGYAAITLAFWIGALVGIVLIAVTSSRVNMRTAIPFAPFLIIGLAIVFFGNVHVVDLINIFAIAK